MNRSLPSNSGFKEDEEDELATDIDDITVSEVSELLHNPPPITSILKEQNCDDNTDFVPWEIPSRSSCAEDKLFDEEDELETDIEDITLSETSELLHNPPPLTSIPNEQNCDDNTDFGPSEIPTCSSCAVKKRFDSGHDVTCGTHIVWGKYFPMKKINEAINRLGRSLTDFFSVKQRFIYYHHGIVSEVMETGEDTAKVKVIEFTSIGLATFKVVETEMEINVRDKNVFYKQYKFPRYNAEAIVQRAQSVKGLSCYELLSNNCEHIAVWCITGEHESFQSSSVADNCLKQIFSWIGKIVGKITQVKMFKVLSGLNRVAKIALVATPCLLISGIFLLIELVVSAVRLVQLKVQKQRGFICSACYNEQRRLLILKIIISFFATVALAAIPASGKFVLPILGIVIGIAAIFILPRLLSFLYRKVKCLIDPLYESPKMVVRKAKHISPGCTLTISNDHAILIKNVTPIGKSTKFVGLDIVHFQYRGVLGNRTVMRERFNFELKRNLLQVLDVPTDEAYPDDDVVTNALNKANMREQGFNPLFYRSSHMSKQCKVRNYNILKTVTLAERDVQTGSDVKAGDMVNFRYLKLPHVGIVVGKSFDDIVQLEFYHVVNGFVKLETKEFDLGSGEIKKILYPVGDVETIMFNAESQRGRACNSFRPYKSARFVKSCIMPEE